MSEQRPIVGVLGGMGPAATVLLMSRLIAITPAEDDEDHIPLLIDHNPQVPSRIKALLEGADESPEPVLITMAQRLAGAGASALAMPCNTAHAYVPAITASVGLPFINMIDSVAAQLAEMDLPNRRIGMLASTAVRQTGLYDKALQESGIKVVFPAAQPAMLEAIKLLKRNADHKQAREIQRRVAEDLLADNVDVLLIACTELSMIADAVPAGVKVVDSLDVLARAICAFSSLAQTTQT